MSLAKDCCVPGCMQTEGNHAVLHRFPDPEKEREQSNTWPYAIGGDILGYENERVHKYRRVCHSHFETKYCCRNNRLSKDAVPTLNMPDTLTMMKFTHAGRKPMKEINNLMQPSTSTTDFAMPHRESLILNEGVERVHMQYGNKRKLSAKQTPPPSVFPTTEKDNQQNLDPEALPLKPSQEVQDANPVIITSNEKCLEPEPLPLKPSQEVRDANPTVKSDQKSQEGQRAVARKFTRRLLLTEKERDLHNTITAAKIKMCKLKSKVKRQTAELKAAKKLSCNPSVLKVIENCTTAAKLLLQIQWRENRKKEKGRRFTLQEKIIALSILKQSPKGYRFFRKIFILPAPQTLIKLVQKSHLKPGINKKIFMQLQKRASLMNVDEKLCVLLFDEVSLKPQLTYNEKKDKVTGFVDNGQERVPEFADHAQVFIIYGAWPNKKLQTACCLHIFGKCD